ncbi:MAG: biotin transporter BioY [Oscillatoriales cyanobacterium SM2_2_1]|nr:biotin transporter BioY [Oscillatoriales cyanobacterium SM2_2_1]
MPWYLRILWAFIGLLLTIASTFIRPALLLPTFRDDVQTIQQVSVTFQIGAVLFTGCVGGRYVALFAQAAYLALGLSGAGVFYQGGGLEYWRYPAFGYLLGFMPAAYVCGRLALGRPRSLEHLTLSCLAGLGTIHCVGILYLLITRFQSLKELQEILLVYSVYSIPGQLAVLCATAVTAYVLRLLLMY